MCGGTSAWARPVPQPDGLSPRVRGNRQPVVRYHIRLRSIPACAVEPKSDRFRSFLNPVYPRVCGGTVQTGRETVKEQGLSPRVRGNHRLRTLVGECARSIPACAGEPPGPPAALGLQRVYPRVCGGTQPAIRRKAPPIGLSPRVRGNRPNGAGNGEGTRSIPACAGEPGQAGQMFFHYKVYPRVCGGTAIHELDDLSDQGLSPRVRGNQVQGSMGRCQGGSIPACAGEPTGDVRSRSNSQVYPRVCGGTGHRFDRGATPVGLSPRVRGNRILPRARGVPNRSIPACAGEPGDGFIGIQTKEVYPRVCGGTRSSSPVS